MYDSFVGIGVGIGIGIEWPLGSGDTGQKGYLIDSNTDSDTDPEAGLRPVQTGRHGGLPLLDAWVFETILTVLIFAITFFGG